MNKDTSQTQASQGFSLISDLKTASPFRDLFPIKDRTSLAVSGSIIRHGYDPAEPIVIWDGIVIDGHTRLAGAIAAGLESVPVVQKHFDSEDEALSYAIKRQQDRRNLTDAEMIHALKVLDERASKVSNLNRGPEAPHGAPAKTGKTASKTATMLGTSQRKIERARTVLDKAPEELKARVEAGETSINAAYNEVTGKPKATKAELPLGTVMDQVNRVTGPALKSSDLEDRIKELEGLLQEREAEIHDMAALLEEAVEENKALAALVASKNLGDALSEVKKAREVARVIQARLESKMLESNTLTKEAKKWKDRCGKLEKGKPVEALETEAPAPVDDEFPMEEYGAPSPSWMNEVGA